MYKPVVTRFRDRIFNPDRPGRKKQLPKHFEENPNWIKIEDVELFKRVFPRYEWRGVVEDFEDWACYVHKMDTYFSSRDFDVLRKDWMERYFNRLNNEGYFFKNNIGADAVNKMSVYELMQIAETEFSHLISINFDTDNPFFEIEELDKVNFETLTRSELAFYCQELKLSRKGNKEDLLLRLREKIGTKKNDTPASNEPVKLSYKDLQEKCKAAGIPATGTYSDLEERLNSLNKD